MTEATPQLPERCVGTTLLEDMSLTATQIAAILVLAYQVRIDDPALCDALGGAERLALDLAHRLDALTK